MLCEKWELFSFDDEVHASFVARRIKNPISPDTREHTYCAGMRYPVIEQLASKLF